MSTVNELRQEAQDKGKKLVDEYNTLQEQKTDLSKQVQEIQGKQNQILIALEKIIGERILIICEISIFIKVYT